MSSQLKEKEQDPEYVVDNNSINDNQNSLGTKLNLVLWSTLLDQAVTGGM